MAKPYGQLFFRDHTHHGKIFTSSSPISPSITSIKFSCGGLTRRESPSNGRLFVQNVSSRSEPLCIVPAWTAIEKPSNNLASSWEEIHGKSDWVGLLDPIEPPLAGRADSVWGDGSSVYDAFDANPLSKHCSSCRFKPSEFFLSLEFPRVGYEVTHYLYASCNIHNRPRFLKKSLWQEGWSESANWFGYVAVSDDEMSKALGRRDMHSMSPIRQKGIPSCNVHNMSSLPS